jgi:hypothetical protein
MAVHFVTGKLGSGKTLVSVSRIREKLRQGLPVATNLDLNLCAMFGRNTKKTRVYRIPDKPTIADLLAIGIGNTSYDESKNGLLVLDECGTWFNSRSWADKSRQDVINWFLHARKLGWDIIFIVQDMNIVDKQARLALAEHVVYCRRTDRANIPIVGSIFKLIFGSKLPLPKLHLGIIRYGDSQTSLHVDTWSTLGYGLYSSYDTKQMFSDFYEHGVYCVLPPWYVYGRYSVKLTTRNLMRLTKIYFRQWSRVLAFAAGSVAAFVIITLTDTTSAPTILADTPVESTPQTSLTQEFSYWRIVGYANLPGQLASYRFTDSQRQITTADTLRKTGVRVTSRGPCEALLIRGDDHASVYCD